VTIRSTYALVLVVWLVVLASLYLMQEYFS
jgi:hypothetical protein